MGLLQAHLQEGQALTRRKAHFLYNIATLVGDLVVSMRQFLNNGQSALVPDLFQGFQRSKRQGKIEIGLEQRGMERFALLSGEALRVFRSGSGENLHENVGELLSPQRGQIGLRQLLQYNRQKTRFSKVIDYRLQRMPGAALAIYHAADQTGRSDHSTEAHKH